MNYFNKIRNLTISVIILAVLNISTIATLIILNSKTNYHPRHLQQPHNSHKFIFNELGLDDNQKAEFEQFRDEFRLNMKNISNELSQKHIELFEEITSAKPDSLKLNELAVETGELHAALKNESTKFFLSMRSICNKEQEKTLFAIFEEMTNKKGRFHNGNEMHKRPMHRQMNHPLR
ncbi:MAG: periplasmic heavy metal sensor [Bacteroidota bacterium]|nr:periplasmic heavy metal sensor [Bacteroidota bacterium]